MDILRHHRKQRLLALPYLFTADIVLALAVWSDVVKTRLTAVLGRVFLQCHHLVLHMLLKAVDAWLSRTHLLFLINLFVFFMPAQKSWWRHRLVFFTVIRMGRETVLTDEG